MLAVDSSQLKRNQKIGDGIVVTAASPDKTSARKRPARMGTGVALMDSQGDAGSSGRAVARPIFFLCDDAEEMKGIESNQINLGAE